MNREELLTSKEYWLSKIQIDLFNEVEMFMEKNNLNRTQLAEKLGVSKGYISQILNGNADHRISKLIELSLAIGMVPRLSFEDLTSVINKDSLGHIINSYDVIESSQNLINRDRKLDLHQINQILTNKILINNSDIAPEKPCCENLSA